MKIERLMNFKKQNKKQKKHDRKQYSVTSCLFKAICLLFLIVASVNANSSNTSSNNLTKQISPSNIIDEATIRSLQAAIQNQEITCQKIVHAYIERIKQYNLSVNDKPPINAFTEINPNSMLEAKKLDEYFSKHQKLQGTLHCVPVIVKDNINTIDMQTTGGSFSLLGNQPTEDAFLVEKLRRAGAILIGKGGMDEFGWSLVGISSRTGRIGNAYDPSQNPGGSSGGVAAAVAANFALVGIGTDNSGSIRIPAAFNGVFGLRPSAGLVSQRGIIPMGNLDAVAGPITRTIADLALILEVITDDYDFREPKTHNVPRRAQYSTALNENGFHGKRIGIVRQIGKKDPFKNIPEEIQTLFDASLSRMKSNGAEIVDAVYFPDFITDRRDNQAGEREDIDEYLAQFPAACKNFTTLCQSNRTRTFGNPSECVKFMRKLPRRGSRKYKRVLQIFEQNKKYVETILKEKKLDAVVLPVTRKGSATYDIFTITSWLAPLASNSGLPSIVLNAGYRTLDGMPVGIELIAKQFDEQALLAMAYTYEKKSPKRIPPILLESTVSYSEYSIREMNSLISELGASTFYLVLKDKKPSMLTPEIFRKIFVKLIEQKK